MKKKKKQKYLSYTEKGVRYLQCKRCKQYHPVSNNKVVAVLCSRCTNFLVPPDKITSQYVPSGKPAGWHFMKEFVDKDGRVFHRGKEQPKLFHLLKSNQKRKLSEDRRKKSLSIDIRRKRKLKRKINLK